MPTIIPLTTESAWLSWLSGPPFLEEWQPPFVPTLVLAPHPDDETLGAGGMIAKLRGAGVPVTVVAVTDGENAYADAASADLGRTRVAEQEEALRRLDVGLDHVQRLHLRDRDVSLCETELVARLTQLAKPGMHLVAPWLRDFHPDHEASGRAAERVAAELGLPLTYYVFWTWHRGAVSTLSRDALMKLALTEDERNRKEFALQAHASQLNHEDGQPILSEELLQPARRGFEVYIRA